MTLTVWMRGLESSARITKSRAEAIPAAITCSARAVAGDERVDQLVVLVVGVGVAVVQHVAQVIEPFFAIQQVADHFGQERVAGRARHGDMEFGVGAQERLGALAVSRLVARAAELVEPAEVLGVYPVGPQIAPARMAGALGIIVRRASSRSLARS